MSLSSDLGTSTPPVAPWWWERGKLPQEKQLIGWPPYPALNRLCFAFDRYYLGAGFQTIQVIGPGLHHLFALFYERRSIVGSAVGIPHRMGQLVFNEIGADLQHLVKDGTRHSLEPMTAHF